MSEVDVVLAKINIIKNCLMAVEKAQSLQIDSSFLMSINELNLQRAIQACIDLANVVIAKEGLGLPTTYAQSFIILQDHGVLSSELTDVMRSLVGFRNISVHDYQTVKPEIVRTIIQHHLTDFESFYATILGRTKTWAVSESN